MASPRKVLMAGLWPVPFIAATAFWWWYTVHSPIGNLLAIGRSQRWVAWGSLAGLWTASGALLQVLLISRAKWLERVFGFDRLTIAHRYNGMLTLACLAAHVVMVTHGHALGQLPRIGFFTQIWRFLTRFEDLPGAAAAAVMLATVGATSCWLVRRRLPYEAWYYTHLSVYVAIALAFGHQFEYGTGLTSDTPTRAFIFYWYALYAFAFGNLLLYRLAIPLVRFKRQRYSVARTERETHNVTSVYIEGRNLAALPARAGQFVFVRFLAPGLRWQKHPFSLSKRPDGTCLRLSIKAVGGYTARIPELRPGIRVLIDGPHGILTADAAAGGKALLIAGGIGITPLRSIAEELAEAGRDVVLLYANRTESDIVFRRELDELAARCPSLKVTHVLSQPGEWSGECGHIDVEKLSRLVPDLAEREVLLCGPPAMMVAVRKALRALGVPGRRVHDERFSL